MKTTVLIFFLLLCSCKTDFFDEGSAVLTNNSKTEIVLLRDYISYNYYTRNDTDICSILNDYYRLTKLDCNESFTIIRWDDYNKMAAADTFSILIFDVETLNNKSWKEISDNYLVLCRYDLSGQDIKTLNSVIPYPPSPAMKDMKMYPSYEEIINKEQK